MEIFGPTEMFHNAVKAILTSRSREGATVSEIRGNSLKTKNLKFFISFVICLKRISKSYVVLISHC